MKLLIISPVIYGMWNQPTYFLIGIIALLFIVQVITEVLKLKTPTNDSYEEIKQLFKQMDSSDYPDEEEVESTGTKLEVVPLDFTDWSYRELQAIAKALGITGRNRKRLILEQELLAVCK